MRVLKSWGLGLGLALLVVLTPQLVHAAPCTLMSVTQGKAELIVYFTKFVAEDKTEGRYKKCRIVKKPIEGTQTFRVTPFRQDANVVVHKSNWP